MVEQDYFDFDEPDESEAGFGGETYEPELDEHRLRAQLRRVRDLMQDGQWRTLSEISSVTGDGEASVSARLRDHRKEQFGGHTVNRRRRGEGKRGLFEYQLLLVKEGNHGSTVQDR